MKQYWLLLLGGMLASCQGGSEPLDIDYTLKDSQNTFNRKPRPAASCELDTVAILTNSRLDSLLAEASREKLKEEKYIKYIPAHVLGFLDCVADGNFSIADPGMMWNSSCSVEEGLPNRELAYLGVGKTITLITYNTGGIAVVRHVAIIKSNGKEILDAWFSQSEHVAANKEQIISSVYSQEHTEEALRKVAFAKHYILNKQDTTISSYDKESFIGFYFWI